MRLHANTTSGRLRLNLNSSHARASKSNLQCQKNTQRPTFRPTVARANAQEGNVFVKGSVAAMTTILNTLRLGSPEQEELNMSEPPTSLLDVKERLKLDYIDKQYFVTGCVDLGLYEEDCLFADPTISFRGRDRYTKNLQTLRAFFLDPGIQLYSLDEDRSEGNRLKAEWRLTVQLRLPWKPNIDIRGSTQYTLNPTTYKALCSRVSDFRINYDMSRLWLWASLCT